MSTFPRPWCLCGGWAIDAWLGRTSREHGDVDLSVFTDDCRQLFDHLAGWQMIHFEGDSLPTGYSQWNGTSYDERADSPMSTPNPSDPEPISDDIHTLLAEVTMVLGGRIKT